MPLNPDLAVPVLPKIQGNLPGFVVEAEHPMVEDLLLEGKSMKQLKFLKPSLTRNLTFDTPWGRFCFMKLPFRLCESKYFFQYYMDLNFENLTNAHIIANDLLIVGSDQGPLDDCDHDRCLFQVLN